MWLHLELCFACFAHGHHWLDGVVVGSLPETTRRALSRAVGANVKDIFCYCSHLCFQSGDIATLPSLRSSTGPGTAITCSFIVAVVVYGYDAMALRNYLYDHSDPALRHRQEEFGRDDFCILCGNCNSSAFGRSHGALCHREPQQCTRELHR